MNSTVHSPKTWRDLRNYLSEQGAQNVRTRGSHEIWQLNYGCTFVVIRNHLSAPLPVWVLAKFRRVQGKRGRIATEDPVLLGRGRNHAGFVLA